MADEKTVTLQLQDGYRFRADFGDPAIPSLILDEPRPLGEGSGPNAAAILAAAVGNCLSASALFCLRRAHVDVRDLRTTATATTARNDAGRMRVQDVRVEIDVDVAPSDVDRVPRCLELFEDYCVVTESVRAGLRVDVGVHTAIAAPSGAGPSVTQGG